MSCRFLETYYHWYMIADILAMKSGTQCQIPMTYLLVPLRSTVITIDNNLSVVVMYKAKLQLFMEAIVRWSLLVFFVCLHAKLVRSHRVEQWPRLQTQEKGRFMAAYLQRSTLRKTYLHSDRT